MRAVSEKISTMSNDTPDDDAAEAPEQQMPEMTTFTVTTTRQFEVDLGDRQLQQMVEQSDAETPEEAVEQIFNEQERQYIEPEQKLIGARTRVEEE
jgi:hypothetical protein